MTSEPTAPHILLVDDDEDFLYQHRIQLEHAGYRVTTATTRAEAEALASEANPDLAILDLMMEQHDDGFVLSHHLKRLLPGLPVILVTAVTAETGLSFSPTSGTERAWVGADAMLAKPIRFEQFKREVERLLRKGQGLGARDSGVDAALPSARRQQANHRERDSGRGEERTWTRCGYWSSTTRRGCGWRLPAS